MVVVVSTGAVEVTDVDVAVVVEVGVLVVVAVEEPDELQPRSSAIHTRARIRMINLFI